MESLFLPFSSLSRPVKGTVLRCVHTYCWCHALPLALHLVPLASRSLHNLLTILIVYPFHNLDSPPNKPWRLPSYRSSYFQAPSGRLEMPKGFGTSHNSIQKSQLRLAPIYGSYLSPPRKAVTSIRDCYDLNVYIPPNSYIEIPVPKGDVIRRGHWEVTRSWGWNPHEWD